MSEIEEAQRKAGAALSVQGCLLDPETAKILQFLDPEIVEMDKKF